MIIRRILSWAGILLNLYYIYVTLIGISVSIELYYGTFDLFNVGVIVGAGMMTLFYSYMIYALYSFQKVNFKSNEELEEE